ncbi:CPBP family intramembrane metalloprotease [Methanohalophilus sp. RSK]|uniref:CPBP family intramembrane glutamic endopeptidase n=1 Tax=Methanohalophilus sp. RSK TaxID=2485783 RepID=UPI000F43D878|nr:type II CAAX endopeptidase family protein [Methanohalophilus sp. RSK]RNI15798.1 CPBP family intramembrane metalloprotease [Methanohalophilus sp. RSK]
MTPGNDLFEKIFGIKEYRDFILTIVPILLIMAAELLIFADQSYFAICLHACLLVGLPLASVYFENEKLTLIFQALILLPLLRLVNISMPIFFETTLYLFIFTYAPLAIPVFLVTMHQGIDIWFLKIKGVNRKWLFAYVIGALILSLGIAEAQYHVISNSYLIPDISLINILKLSLVMVLFVGLIEELIFRVILQTRLEQTFGIWPGLIVTSLLFGVMHSGYGTIYEVLVASIAGLLIGYIFIRTRNLTLIALIHGFVNVFLFGIIPHLGPTLGLI